MNLELIGAILGVIGGSIYLHVPKRFLLYEGILGGLGWMVYLLIEQQFSMQLAVFITGLFIAIVSNILSRWIKTPASLFLIPGLLTLVPGVALYRSVYYFLQDSPLSQDALRETFTISGLIALSIFVVDAFVKSFLKK